MTPRTIKPIFAAIVLVRPIPDSLIYTGPIYKKLKSFGDVKSFKKSTDSLHTSSSKLSRPLGEQSFRAIFSKESELHKALAASPFSIDVDHNLPRLEGLDPYNVFGLQDRKRPEPRSFTCHLRAAKENHTNGTNSLERSRNEEVPLRVKLIKDEKAGPLYKSLLEAGVPLSQLEGLATSITSIPTEQTGPSQTVDDSTSASELVPAHSTPATQNEINYGSRLRLMDMYRSALRKRGSQQEQSNRSKDQTLNPSVPIIRMPTTLPSRRRSYHA